jgi:hypothetical protein
LVIIGLARGFGFLLPGLVRLIVLTFSVLLIGGWLADWAASHLTFLKPGFWNPFFFLSVFAGTFFLMRKLSKLRASKGAVFFHPFWDRILGAATGFFWALLFMSLFAQFLVSLPSQKIQKLYGSKGARYGALMKQFAPDFVDVTLAPLRAILQPKGGSR